MSANESTPPASGSEPDARSDIPPGANVTARSVSGDGPVGRYVPQSLADLRARAQRPGDWLWHGYLAPGNLTLLTSLWKAGKSTLISVLLARMKTGGTLADRALTAGRALVVSEEPPGKWVERSQCVDLDGHVDWFCLPFAGKPTHEAWLEFVADVERQHERQPFALLVIDALANLSPMRSENDAVQMLRPLQPLRRLTERGVAVLIAHHPHKGRTLPGQAARGSGALAAFVDIIVEMDGLSRRPADRRRLLRAFSRHAATPPRLVIEWTADGRDYRSLGTSTDLDYEHGWPVVQAILEQGDGPMTRRDILRLWPDRATQPAALTLWRWLGRAVQEGRVLKDGRGSRKQQRLCHCRAHDMRPGRAKAEPHGRIGGPRFCPNAHERSNAGGDQQKQRSDPALQRGSRGGDLFPHRGGALSRTDQRYRLSFFLRDIGIRDTLLSGEIGVHHGRVQNANLAFSLAQRYRVLQQHQNLRGCEGCVRLPSPGTPCAWGHPNIGSPLEIEPSEFCWSDADDGERGAADANA